VVILVTIGIITMAMEAPAPITAVLQVLGGAVGIALQEAMGEVVDSALQEAMGEVVGLALQEEAGEVLGVALRAVAGEVLEDAERDTYIGKRKDQYSVMKIMNNQALLRNANQKARNTDLIVKKLCERLRRRSLEHPPWSSHIQLTFGAAFLAVGALLPLPNQQRPFSILLERWTWCLR